ncbi:2-phosphosulfolactate phosphatase [Balneicella halophila]|uniref:Probable 2-phosphosulfolactate phosphatase n=1 Tax=Balneicella halophila TaxID=1537566 RepID=A0A7L4URS1_BALHA|nr:2-phosphosulfolactate phosphatase [Balneicella halophila]PVX52453.1 2-phosphosulfolactate phosphatase [Balneicella halophila]
MKKIEICLAPVLYPHQKLDDSIVVVIDIFRATTTFCVALANGVESIKPFASAEETFTYKNKEGYMIAGERNGYKLEGFDLSNSPKAFMNNDEVKGKKIAFTTTNGTQAISLVKDDATVVIGSFLNEGALLRWLVEQDKNVLLLCSGWKNTINYEDTLFAGSLAEKMIKTDLWEHSSDSVEIAMTLYNEGRENLLEYIYKKSARIKKRSEEIGQEFEYCMKRGILQNVPIFRDGYLINYEE